MTEDTPEGADIPRPSLLSWRHHHTERKDHTMTISDKTPAYVVTVFHPKEFPTTTVVSSPGDAEDIIAKALLPCTVADEYAVRRDAEWAVEAVQKSVTVAVTIRHREARLILTRSHVQAMITP